MMIYFFYSEFIFEIRLQLVDVLINGGLNPDHFPSPLNPVNAGGETLQRNGFKWQTPLSLVLSHSPFSDASLAAVLSFLSNPSHLVENPL